MTSTTQDGPDTALARVLHAQGALPLPTLQNLLERVRAQRLHDPDASLEALLRANHTLPPHTLQRALDSLAPPPPTLGPYVLQRELARGGMGAVHLALDPHTGAHLALKTLPRELAQDPDILLRFQAEAQLAAQLDHPHIARVHAADFSADPPYLVQELLTGGSLQDRLQHGPLPVDEAVRVVSQLCDAVAHAHQHGVIHRDLKPDNVLFDEHGQAKLVDFGLARQLADAQRLTHTGELLGTPNYMAPEQAEGRKDTDERADVYGLGGILYACLTGQPPFQAPTLLALLQKVLEDAPRPPSRFNAEVPRALDEAVAAALAKRPEDRPPSARTWAESLRAPPPPRRRRSRMLWGLGLAGAALVAVAWRSETRSEEDVLETVEGEETPQGTDAGQEAVRRARAALLREDSRAALAALRGWHTPEADLERGRALLWQEDLEEAATWLSDHELALKVERARRTVAAAQRARLRDASETNQLQLPQERWMHMEQCEALLHDAWAVRACVGEELWPQFRERLHVPGLLEIAGLQVEFFLPSSTGRREVGWRTFRSLVEAYTPRNSEPVCPTSAMAMGWGQFTELLVLDEDAAARARMRWLEQWPAPGSFHHPVLRNLALLGQAFAHPDPPHDPWGRVDALAQGRQLPLELELLELYLYRHKAHAQDVYLTHPTRDPHLFQEAVRWQDALLGVIERAHWRPGSRIASELLQRVYLWAHAPAFDPLTALLPPLLARRVDLRALYTDAARPFTIPKHFLPVADIFDLWLDLAVGHPLPSSARFDDALRSLGSSSSGDWADSEQGFSWREAGLRLRFGWAARTGRWWIALRDASRLGRFDSPLRWQRGDPWHELRQPGPSRWTTW